MPTAEKPPGHNSLLPSGYVMPYRHEIGVTAQASANFMLAFMTLVSALHQKARKAPPAASAVSYTQDLFSCDFEQGWCPGWNQSSTDKLDWLIGQGSTKTNRTGPDVDHTLLNTAGHYAYIEATGASFGDTALFRTPYVTMNAHSKYCFRFWYLMYGTGIGSLKVFWSPPKRVGNSPPTVFLLSTLSGSDSRHGKDWLEYSLTLSSPSTFNYRKPVYFEFQATRGFLPRSDIAVDDISLTPGSCENITSGEKNTKEPTSIPPLPTAVPTTSTSYKNVVSSSAKPLESGFNCTFEEGWCTGWNQTTADKLDWLVGQGSTKTKGTGPEIDRTLGTTDGHYAYMEATGAKLGNKAIFRTPYVSMNSHSHYCFRFWYLMHGSGMGTLKVYWSPPKKIGTFRATVFLVSAKSGPNSRNGFDWIQESVTMISPTSFNYYAPVYFEFQATRGFLSKSDIAVDDISLTPGACKDQTTSNTASRREPTLTPSTSTAVPTTTTSYKKVVSLSAKPFENGFNCTFEEGWCTGWNQTKADKLDWLVGQGSTKTKGTGPEIDRTLGTKDGHYAYMEATGAKLGNKAIFRTPYVSMNSHSRYCFRFWYLMHGSGMGTLKVYWSPPKKIGTFRATVFLVSAKSGPNSRNGFDWIQESVTMISPTSFNYYAPVYFEFQATRGFLSKSDIAVDDISLTPGACKDQTTSNTASRREPTLTPSTSTAVPTTATSYKNVVSSSAKPAESGFNCTFEEGWCTGWNQTKADKLDWLVGQGSTKTKGTGPEIDRTLGTKDGHYAYMEATGAKLGNKAIFRTPYVSMNSHSRYCFRFWYLMHGSGMGTLKVFWSPPKKIGTFRATVYLVSAKSGPVSRNGSDWIQESVTMISPTSFNHYAPVYFEFQATRGFLSKSDIAVDDISLTPGACKDQTTSNAASRPSHPNAGAITVGPTTIRTTTPWIGNNPNYKQCGGRYYNVHQQQCCDGMIRNIRGKLKCCGRRLYKPDTQSCCGKRTIRTQTQGCCGQQVFMLAQNGCCGNNLFGIRTQTCVDGRVVPKN